MMVPCSPLNITVELKRFIYHGNSLCWSGWLECTITPVSIDGITSKVIMLFPRIVQIRSIPLCPSFGNSRWENVLSQSGRLCRMSNIYYTYVFYSEAITTFLISEGSLCSGRSYKLFYYMYGTLNGYVDGIIWFCDRSKYYPVQNVKYIGQSFQGL